MRYYNKYIIKCNINEVRKKFICIENKGMVLQENIAEIFYVEINDI